MLSLLIRVVTRIYNQHLHRNIHPQSIPNQLEEFNPSQITWVPLEMHASISFKWFQISLLISIIILWWIVVVLEHKFIWAYNHFNIKPWRHASESGWNWYKEWSQYYVKKVKFLLLLFIFIKFLWSYHQHYSTND